MTKFKVGDKVRMLDKDSVFASDATINGETYTVIEVYFDGDIRIDDKSGGYPLLINESEFHAIEKLTGGDSMKHRTVKRKARVGERTLITKAQAAAGRYANGDVLTVREETGRSGTDDAVLVVDKNVGIFDYEYEVIVGTNGNNETQQSRKRVDALEAEIEALKGRIATLEKADKPRVTNVTINASHPNVLDDLVSRISTEFRSRVERLTAPKLAPNQQRKATIERAKSFVEDVKERALNFVMNDDGNHIFNRKRNKLTFHVNAEKRVVTALAHSTIDGKLLGKAFAKCAPGDVFNADIGMAIAAGRLYGLDVSEFEQAVQPTEWQVGMRVTEIDGIVGLGKVVRVVDGKAYTEGASSYWPAGLSNCTTATGIDDTEAQY